MCLRGGYGSGYLLGDMDLDLIRKHPKPFFAYSDLTGVQLRLLDALGLPAFHGPMAAADFYLDDGVHLPSFRAALAGELYGVGAAEGLRVLQPGKAEGILYGGCLSILVALLGTEWEPQTEDKLLFIEDVGASPTRWIACCGSCATQASWRPCAALSLARCSIAFLPARPELLEQAILSALAGFDGPIAIGLRSGHVSRQNVTLTFGVPAELSGRLRSGIAFA